MWRISRFELFKIFTEVEGCARESSGANAATPRAAQKIIRRQKPRVVLECLIPLLLSAGVSYARPIYIISRRIQTHGQLLVTVYCGPSSPGVSPSFFGE